MACDTKERIIEEALRLFSEKGYAGTSMSDIAERLNCDPSTVRRNRTRLVRMLALRLYGVGGGICGISF